ncbi:hypothetical protein [Sphaerisporangium perillae]|uniref:hypothetical protein n=1 Tax=Sphaerisporangium perillae TaxID=2935860 RepID=UPI0020101D24|nr:hypothetical protein [Sphaerisporangium perillae]
MNERELRTLLIKATEDRPAGIDLMPRMTHRPKRTRSLVPMIAAVGVVAAVGTTVLVLPGSQPSAQAQVAAAIENTSSESYRIHVDAGVKTFDGAFDPVQRVGSITGHGDGTDTRFIGDLMYIREPGAPKWTVYPRSEALRKDAPAATVLVKLAPLDPQGALQQLRSATDVREDGSASGTGWTGQRFKFSLNSDERLGSSNASDKPFTVTGAVEVDDQGRVRRLEVTFSDNGQRDVMDFGDFGTPVTVTAPPADQVQQKPDDNPDVKPTGTPDQDQVRQKPDDKATGKPDQPGEKPTVKNP